MKKHKEPRLLKSLRSIALIEAYRPSHLKEYMLSSNKFFKKLNRSSNLDGVYLRSILRYFREW